MGSNRRHGRLVADPVDASLGAVGPKGRGQGTKPSLTRTPAPADRPDRRTAVVSDGQASGRQARCQLHVSCVGADRPILEH